MMNDVHSLLKI